MYIYTPPEKAKLVSYEFTFFYRNLKNLFFCQNPFFGNGFPYLGDFLLKTKMVRTVHRNIVYKIDWKICDSKSGFGTKSQNGRFQKWGLKMRKLRFWVSKWSLWGRFQRRKYSKIYPGLIPHHPGSRFIYKTHFLKKNHLKSSKFKKNL